MIGLEGSRGTGVKPGVAYLFSDAVVDESGRVFFLEVVECSTMMYDVQVCGITGCQASRHGEKLPTNSYLRTLEELWAANVSRRKITCQEHTSPIRSTIFEKFGGSAVHEAASRGRGVGVLCLSHYRLVPKKSIIGPIIDYPSRPVSLSRMCVGPATACHGLERSRSINCDFQGSAIGT
jgi:hypothetical protein